MNFYSKIRWGASILLVFSIVLITNLIDKDNFNQLKYSVTTIFEDRIVANDLLFEISMLIQEKEIAIISTDSLFFQNENIQVNRNINSLIERYEKTKLTDKEQVIFTNLKDNLHFLHELEKEYIVSKRDKGLLKSINKISQHLYDLSKVQLHEGRQQMLISNKAMSTIELLTQGEIVFLIVMGILIQIIIWYKPKKH